MQLGVSTLDQTELLPSGAMSRYRNRILWALFRMKRAGVIQSPGRGQYAIIERGQALLAEVPNAIRTKTLERYPEYVEFLGRSHAASTDSETVVDEAATPEERLQASRPALPGRCIRDRR
jgi:restriction system protein